MASTPSLGTTVQGILGAVISAYRSQDALKLKQSDIAEKLGVTVSTWSKIERGESSISLEQLVAVAEVLKVPLSELFRCVEEKWAELDHQNVKVVISKDELSEDKLLPLSNSQIAAMVIGPNGLKLGAIAGVAGAAGMAAFGLYKALVKPKK